MSRHSCCTGSLADILHVAATWTLGTVALAVAMQGVDFWRRVFGPLPRTLVAAGALCLLFPASLWVAGIGILLLAGSWALAGRLGAGSPTRHARSGMQQAAEGEARAAKSASFRKG